MKTEHLNRILDVYDASLKDPVYMERYHRYKRTDRKMARLLRQLPNDSQDIVMDYIAATAELQRRLLELACALPPAEKSPPR